MMDKSNQILVTLTLLISVTTSATINDFGSKKCLETSTCNSETCQQVSQKLLENLDQTENPCDDFYQFACGGYMKSKKIPDDKPEISTLSEMNVYVINQLYSIFKKPIDANEPATFKLAKHFYNVCMNTHATEENNLKTARKLLKEFGGWPVIEGASWKENEFDWKKLTYKFREYGFAVNRFLGIGVAPNVKNSSQNIVIFDDADLPLNRQNLEGDFSDPIVKLYYNYLVDLAVLFGANKETALSQMKDVIEFLLELGKITTSPEDRRNVTATTNIMTVAELQQRFPYMNWLNFINNVIAIPGIQINENDIVDVGSPKFINNIETLLNKTPKKTQANYLISVAVASIAYTLNEKARNREFQLNQEASGIKVEEPRWNVCLNLATLKLKTAIGALYARTFFKQNSKSGVQLMVSNLHLKLMKMLNEADWMDEETRKKALEKASFVESHVGYPPELMDDKIIDEYYAQLKPSDDYLEFVINIQKFDSDNKFKRVREKVQKGYWVDISGTNEINAFYNRGENSIILPAGILQGMIFGIERPQAMNFGAIGFIIGHELTHGFDDVGKQANKDGQLENWWSESTSVNYAQKAECLIKQYSSYKSTKLNLTLNGVITQGENIADNGGAKLAYDTYQSWLKHYGDDKCLPNINYTQNQLFWIALANAWCTSTRDEKLKNDILVSDHPPAYFRVMGVTTNSKHFANDFDCPLGSRMNPVHKCTFW
ncbi:hypothetical protein RN001_008076 [Aquatica leii]|uniref:Neprilysin n=1 Tax=Aquatica leii TaxID=1421715 RepID=A0AAN7SR79_9COLE|nr:hypothetical protein RN001_008076 [Aquatica leii]